MNKPLSPSSSITSQRKLEWDSLADVGYANESDRKTSASSLSTLERLALIQQYSNNDNQSSNIGAPTSHSTPLDENETKSKTKKGFGKKTTKIYKKDIDLVEVNVPQSSDNPTQSINVNLTKHISFNVEKDGKITVEDVQKNVSVSPEKVMKEDDQPKAVTDKEIQTSTSLLRMKDVSIAPEGDVSTVQDKPKPTENPNIKIPVMISLNTLRKKTRRKRMRMARRKLKAKKKSKEIVQEKSVEQLSEAESFEYMPGHIYNQNQLQAKEKRPSNAAGNKSSLESSGVLTTDSSKGSAHSFTKDLEKSIELLRNALRDRCDDSNLRRQLIKQICERLIKSKYRDDDSTSDFLSGFTFRSKKTLERNLTTTSTSDANDSGDKLSKPKKSILRNEKFNAGAIASTSQSAPNLPMAIDSDKPVSSKLPTALLTSNTDSELSSKEKTSSDNVFAKTSSEELYQKYLAALRREQAYKRHLKDKEMFLKQKLVNSDGAFNVTPRDAKVNNRLQDLIKDLTRNNYDDGSGDASKLEGGPNSNIDFDRFLPIQTQRSHSVFTLSSGNSDYQNKKCNLKKRLQCSLKDMTKPGTSKDHYCCCPHHSNRFGVTDSSVQVNIKVPCEGDPANERPRSRNNSPKRCTNISPRTCIRRNSPRRSPRRDTSPQKNKFVCICNTKASKDTDDLILYKCGNSMNKGDSCSLQSTTSSYSKNENHPTTSKDGGSNKPKEKIKPDCQNVKKSSKSSQTNLLLKMLCPQSSDRNVNGPGSNDRKYAHSNKYSDELKSSPTYTMIYESSRCIQTEISINPRISDPTLSDINIVNDSSCANLIRESCRPAPKQSLMEFCNSEFMNQATFSGTSKSTKSSGTSKNVEEIKDELGEVCDLESEKNCKPNENTPQCTPIQTNVEDYDDISIPIQGTNMTLLVSFNSLERQTCVMPVTQNAFVNTDEINKEQGTSLTEECSKEAQCNGIVVLRNTNNCKNNQTTQDDTINPVKRVPISVSKNLDRANAKVDIFKDKCSNPNSIRSVSKCVCGCGVEGCNNQCLQSKKKKTASIVILDSTRQCACGCEQPNCNSECFQSNSDVTNACKNLTEYVRKCSIKCHESCSKLLQTKDECSCGCGREGCNGQCFKTKTKIINQPVKPNKTKCDCGCSKIKEECGNKCIENKNQQTDTKCKPEPKPECSCGCGHEGCNDQCFKTINKINNQPVKPNKEQCDCGCSKNKKECGNKCIGNINQQNYTKSKPKPKPQCSCGCDREGCKDQCFKTMNIPSNKPVKPKTKKCNCGCSKMKEECGNKCIETKNQQCDTKSKPEPKPQCPNGCGNEGCNDQCLNTTNIANTQPVEPNTEKYDCKCPKYIDECGKKCIESKVLETGNIQCSALKTPSSSSGSSCKKEIGIQKDFSSETKQSSRGDRVILYNMPSVKPNCLEPKCTSDSADNLKRSCKSNVNILRSGSDTDQDTNDPILDMIQNITNRYSKTDLEKNKRKKCFKEIMNVLKYLVETEDCSEQNKDSNPCESSTSPVETEVKESQETVSCAKKSEESLPCIQPKKFVDKGIQLCTKKSKRHCTESSDMCSTDFPGTSSDSATCKVLNKIKKECEKYHQKRCKCQGKKCDGSSSTSVNCDQCRRMHYCNCRIHKCKSKRCIHQSHKKPFAYNLIIQTSDSIMSEETPCQSRQLKNIVVKVPPKKKVCKHIPFKELEAKIESRNCQSNRPEPKCCRSKSLPNESEISSLEEILRKTQACTVREYLEKNRPDFVENCSQRQNCLKICNATR